MPVPSPKGKEKQQEFISRCIETMENRDPDRKHEQIQAMCYSAWRKAKRKWKQKK